MAASPEFSENVLDRMCDILGDTSTGLTGSEIGRYLGQFGVRRRSGASRFRRSLLRTPASSRTIVRRGMYC